MQWVTHEVWVPGRRTVAFVDWPRGMRMIDVDRGDVRQLTTSPAWHAAPDDAGERFVCDTNFPDRGLHIFEVDGDRPTMPSRSAPARRRPRASTGAARFPTTTARSRSKPRQHTHPHPRFSPDGSRVVFTSDRTGHAQLYEVMLEDGPMTGPAMLESQRVRQEIRAGRITGTSRGLAHGFVQCNLAILPKAYAFDFLLYCQRNQRACPVLEVTDPGDPVPKQARARRPTCAPTARAMRSIATACAPRTAPTSPICGATISSTFLIGSGISIDGALERAGVPTHKDRWVLRTTLPTEPAGPFRGDMIVTMRWLTAQQAITATQVTSRFPFNHGAPIHLGDPAAIGADLDGAAVRRPGAADADGHRAGVLGLRRDAAERRRRTRRLPFFIAHAPAHSFITDLPAEKPDEP